MNSTETFSFPTAATGTRTGGYKVNLKTGLTRKWQCPICKLLIRDAIQTYRGEMACESCFNEAKGDSDICPIDREPIEEGEFFKDRHSRRQILQLDCYCSNKDNGCSWEGEVQEADERHTTTCPFENILCESCMIYLLRKDLDNHINNLCAYRRINCSYCNTVCDAKSIKEHQSTCLLKPMQCPFECGEHIALDSLYSHVEQCKQVSHGKMCPYQVVGCTYRAHSTQERNTHMQKDKLIHAALSASIVQYLLKTNESMKDELQTGEAFRMKLTKEVEEHNTQNKRMKAEIIEMTNRVEIIQSEITKLDDKFSNYARQVEEDLKDANSYSEESTLLEMNATLVNVGKRYKEMEMKVGKMQKPTTSSASVDNSRDVKEGIAKIDELEGGEAMLCASLADLELKLQLLEHTCYNGQQLWKVDNLSYRRGQAVNGKVTAVYSAPCFQKRGGYKFCSRLYLNGDGIGRGTHVSLFFIVMKSEYDSLLPWPFTERVTFRLINPHNQEESVQQSFLPDRNSSSFKRPTKDMNIAAGCPLLLEKDLLDHFVVDDCLYIEITISSS